MKKMLLFVCLCTLVGVSLTSCQSDEVIEQAKGQEVSQYEELARIQEQIRTYNHENIGVSLDTRVGGSRKVAYLAMADYYGARLGGIFGNLYGAAVGAVCTSFFAYILDEEAVDNNGGDKKKGGVEEDDGGDIVGKPFHSAPRTRANVGTEVDPYDPSDVNPLDYVVVQEPGQTLSASDSIGYFHNKVILDVLEKKLINDSMTDEQIMNKLYSATSKATGVPLIQLMQSKSSITSFINNCIRPMNGTSSTRIFAAYISANYPSYDAISGIMNEFQQGLSGIVLSQNDGSYLLQVLTIIRNSSLDEQTKSELRNMLITCNASYRLWTIHYDKK